MHDNSLRDDSEDDENETYELQLLNSNEDRTLKQETDIALFTWPIIYRIFCNFLLSFCNVIYTEFLPILLSKSIDVESLKFPIHSRGDLATVLKLLVNFFPLLELLE